MSANAHTSATHMKALAVLLLTMMVFQPLFSFANGPVAPTSADLVANKKGPAQVLTGGAIIYTLTAKNDGPAVAQNVVIRDSFPIGFTFVSDNKNACTASGRTLTCRTNTLAAATSFDIAATFQVNAAAVVCGDVENQISAFSDTTDPNLVNNLSEIVRTRIQCPQFEIDKTGPATANAGDTIAYKVVVKNTGTAIAKNVVLNDNINGNTGDFLFVPAESTNTCRVTPAPGYPQLVFCDKFDLEAGAQKEFTFAFKSLANKHCGETIVNQADVRGENVVTQWDKAMTVISCPKPNLEIKKTGPATAVAGSKIKYTIVVKNTGDAPTTGANVADHIQDNPLGEFAFVSAESSPECRVLPNVAGHPQWIHCNGFELQAGAQKTFSVTFQSTANKFCGQTIINQADIKATGAVSQWDKAMTVIEYPPAPKADLIVTKTGPATVLAGQKISYTVKVKNIGLATTENVVMTDIYPHGLTFLPAESTAGCTLTNTLTCPVGTLASGAEKTFTLVFQVPAAAVCGATISNKATVLGSAAEDVVNNNATLFNTVIQCPIKHSDVSVIKTGASSVLRGDRLNYTVTVSNSGPDAATGVTLTDTFPAGLTFVPAASTTGCTLTQANVLSCPVGTLTGGQTRSFTFAFDVANDTALCGKVIKNVARIASGGLDTQIGNNEDDAVTTVTCVAGGQPNLNIAKTDNKTETRPNEILTYVITVTNTGTVAATGATVIDTLPPQTTFVSASSNSVHENGIVRFTNQTFAAGSTTTYIISARVIATAENGTVLRNKVTVADKIADDTTVVVREEPKIELEIEDHPTEVPCYGGDIEYTIKLRNRGSVNQRIDVVATLDEQVEFDDASDNGDYDDDDHEVLWEDVLVVAGSTETLRVMVNLDENDIDDDSVQLSVRAGDKTASEETNIEDEDDCDEPEVGIGSLTVDKIADRREVQPGSIVRYTVAVRNNGGGVLRDVRVEDQFTSGSLTIEDADGGQALGNGLLWIIPVLQPGEVVTFDYRVRVGSSMRHGDLLVNTVRVTAPALDRPATDTVTVSVIQYLPQTGIDSLGTSLGQSSSFVRLPGGGNGSSSVPFVLLTTIMAAGLAGGGMLGKRYFL